MTTLLPGRAPAESVPRTRPSPDLLAMLHAVNPYEGFDASRYPFDPQGWNGDSPLFGRLVAELQPRIAIEVGSWKGQSAINTARHLRAHRPDAQLCCVDTWLGSLDFWASPRDTPYQGMQLRHGYPTFYWQFLANVVHAGLQDVIVPFPNTSVIAARLLIARGVQAEMIYIDASHEENDVYMDIVYYWHALRPGGVMFGDDYRAEFYPGVVAAVAAFGKERQLVPEIVDRQFWLLRKPAG
jgi:predicted O-methyltransferase YrrM